ncbi:MAG TPA: tRNA lysidine(34) synthetase TilS [Bacteroidia bacterium]|nr:tRNA lysidine(34) synthetase TilS [Bacteroidia bacterium]HRH09041.1 tRNA lysidine(34) synthetase TilS [Bacteroidia bacterium]
MQKHFEKFVGEQKLFEPGDKILLAVSGGLDSMVMLYLFIACKATIAVAHCNFKLRGKESNEDERFVKLICEKNAIPFYSTRFDTKKFAHENQVSIQMAARNLRYEWFEKLRKKINANYISTAHHKTDVAETMLINLLRGTGISGLHGIYPKKNKLIRPLLFSTRSELEKFAIANKINFREDKSNASTEYVRNQIRHWVLPQLAKINPEFEEQFYASAQNIYQSELLYRQLVQEKQNSLQQLTHSDTRLSIVKLKKLNPLPTYLYEFLKSYNFNSTVCTEISEALNGKSGKIFSSSSHRLLVDREELVISKIELTKTGDSFLINKNDTAIDHPIQLKFKTFQNNAAYQLKRNKSIAQIDLQKIEFPLVLRKWKEGDKFYPLGMKGSKKLSDFFIDTKLSIFEKEKIWLLCSGDKIVWIVNHRLDNRFKINSTTQKIIEVAFHQT